jgi:hypothetical protein
MKGPVDRIAAFVEDLIHNRRPCRFKAAPEEFEALRAASELSAARPGADLPDRAFMDQVRAYINVTVRAQCRAMGLMAEVPERIFP